MYIFIGALFTLAKTWKQPKCLSRDEWIKRCGMYVCICAYIHTYMHTHTHTYTHTMEYYSVIKKNEIIPSATTWMDLEMIILSEVS